MFGKPSHAIEPLPDVARQLSPATFTRWHLDRGAVLPAMQQPLPNVDAILHETDEQARHDWSDLQQRRAAKPPGTRDLFANALNAGPDRKAPPADTLRLELTIQFAFAVARADGRLARKEKELIEAQLDQRYGSDPVERNRAKAFCAQYEHAVLDPEACFRRIAQTFSTEERAALLAFGCEIADATGDRNPRE